MKIRAAVDGMLRRTWIAVAICVLGGSSTAGAQAWDKIVTEVQQVSISQQCWDWRAPLDSDCRGLHGGVALELSYELTTLFRDTPYEVELDFGLGYSESNRFTMTRDSLRLAGVVREQPALFICAAKGGKYAAVFACGRTGHLSLHDTQAWDSTVVSATNSFNGTGSIFQLGGSGGIVFGVEPVLITAQVSRTWRNFDAVTWKGEASKTLPRALPRTLDLSGVGISLGVNIQVKNRPDDGAAAWNEGGSNARTRLERVRRD
jgi:hypothetical protein